MLTARSTPIANDAADRRLLSTNICWISLPRPAPIESRSAISRSSAAARAMSRLATLEQAISNTRNAMIPSTYGGRSKSCRRGVRHVRAKARNQRIEVLFDTAVLDATVIAERLEARPGTRPESAV